ncbi:hypothetical protein C9J21_20640 [Photobacterium phosphoreum]|uniref:hypothetical protein n=1 Tax=Photobacterium phosphoreum TaxID=659 RepID=UPI000D1627DC|nr:hypothetical protein [Photobacterium phosphoreum]PSW28404.1 hypothetical protein C9J21_20640 [Photobacterium phosphoreum]
MSNFFRNSLVLMTVKDHKYNRNKQLIKRTLVTHTAIDLGNGTFFYNPTGNLLFSNIETIDSTVNGYMHIAVGNQENLAKCLCSISSSIKEFSSIVKGIGYSNNDGGFSCLYPHVPELKDVSNDFYKPLHMHIRNPLTCDIKPFSPLEIIKNANDDNIISGINGTPLKNINDVFNNPIIDSLRENDELAIWLNGNLLFSNVKYFDTQVMSTEQYIFKAYPPTASTSINSLTNLYPMTGINFF